MAYNYNRTFLAGSVVLEILGDDKTMECEIDGIAVYYEVVGQGRPVVMIHG